MANKKTPAARSRRDTASARPAAASPAAPAGHGGLADTAAPEAVRSGPAEGPGAPRSGGSRRRGGPAVVPAPTPPDDAVGGPLPEAQLRKVKTGLTKKDLEHYRELLVEKRVEILGDVAALETDARTDSGDRLSPEHMADIGSNNYEQEFTLGLVESERRLLAEIDEALIRIRNRTYGVCVERGVPIGRARLDAKPWAKYCIEVVRERESRGET